MVIYAKMQGKGGFVPDYMVGLLAYPDPAPVAKRSADRLAEVGFAEITEGGYYVAAAEGGHHCCVLELATRSRIRFANRSTNATATAAPHAGPGMTGALHIIPWCRCGPDTVKNLQVLCASCNSSKGARA